MIKHKPFSQPGNCTMHRSKAQRYLAVVVLLTFMLSGGVWGASWFNPLDLATCVARGGQIASSNDSGDT